MLKKTTLRRAGGIVVSAAVVCTGSAMVAAATLANPGSAATTVPDPLTPVSAGEYVSVCPDPAHLLEGALESADPQFNPESETARSTVTAMVLAGPSGSVLPGTLSELGSTDPLQRIGEKNGASSGAGEDARGAAMEEQYQAAVVPALEVKAPAVLRAQPYGQQEASAGALMTYSAGDGDLRGLAAANCQRPANDLWLLGANTTPGQTALLNIHNPSSTPATVDLELYGAEGPIESSGTRGILVPPGKSESVVLGGLAPGQDHLALRVDSSGGSVTANIQQSVLRDLTPGGVEYISPVSSTSARQVVTGVRIQDKSTAGAISGQDGYASAGPALHIAVPGTSEAVLEVKAFGADGQEPLPEGGVLTVPGESVHAMPLDSLPKGTYTVVITSDVSVAASARISKGTEPGKPVDMAFRSSADRMGSRHVITVPGDAGSTLIFGAPDDDAEVELIPVDAASESSGGRTIRIDGGTTKQVQVDQGGDSDIVGYIASASGGAVYGSQVLTSEDTADIAVVPFPEAVKGPQDLRVNLGY